MTNPEKNKSKFKCPHCQTVAKQDWAKSDDFSSTVSNIYNHIYLDYREDIADYKQTAIKSYLDHSNLVLESYLNQILPHSLFIATCQECGKYSLWINNTLVYPQLIFVELPNDDLNEEIKSLFIEAATIVNDSPKGSAALLRLALQKFLKQVGKKGKDINGDIKELVAEGMSVKIQQSLDILRVVGNHAVHPGEINLNDNKEIAMKLFRILNILAEELISKPKEIDDLYKDIIPEQTKEAINNRDS